MKKFCYIIAFICYALHINALGNRFWYKAEAIAEEEYNKLVIDFYEN
jgi:hypothetical protein